MRLWISKNSEVPLREQLTTQVVLGIMSNDLKAGQRLPSTRELARRFHIHSNTVSAAYRELEQRGWLEFRRGSGVYVRARTPRHDLPPASRIELDQLISSFLQLARGSGFSLAEIQERVKHWLELQPPDHFLVIEPNTEARRILVAEVEEATRFAARGVGLEECAANPALLTGAAPVALYWHAESVRAALPHDTNCILLHSRSIPDSMRAATPPPPDALVVVASGWPSFLHWSRVMLVAAGLDPEALTFLDTRERDWQRALRAADLIICDALTARHLPAEAEARVFRLISDSSLGELRSYVERFLTQ